MEPSGRNRWQLVANGTGPKTAQIAYRQPVATHGNRFGAHGKEGVDGSSPSEGFRNALQTGMFLRFLLPIQAREGTLREHLTPLFHREGRDHGRGYRIQ